MGALDLAVVTVYLVGTVWLGLTLSRGQATLRHYFTTDRCAPWPVVMASIVATETSTVTLVSIPGFAFGTDLTFLQLVAGYLVGRALVTWLLLPGYFRGDYFTAYQLLTVRFGRGVGRLAASIFLITRNLSDGLRLMATGLVVGAALLTVPGIRDTLLAWFPWVAASTSVLVVSVIVLGVITIAYTYNGGMNAVLWTDVLQLLVYLGGSLTAAVLLLDLIPGGWAEVVATGTDAGRFRVFDFSTDLSRSYTVWSGVIGGACLTLSTHGTDQLLVQRYLCSRSSGDAGKALLLSGVVVFAQFVLFLLIGVMLYAYYTTYTPELLVGLTRDGQLQTDRLFPTFIVSALPSGLRGLVVAAIVAAAMSTLSSSLNASSSSTMADFYLPMTGQDQRASRAFLIARRATIGWGLVQMLVAVVAINFSQRIVDEVLSISSFTNGLILGIFLLGRVGVRSQVAAYLGVTAGTIILLGIRLLTDVSWQWYVLVGATVTVVAGWAANRLRLGFS